MIKLNPACRKPEVEGDHTLANNLLAINENSCSGKYDTTVCELNELSVTDM